jgi:hypothetical protein
MQAAGSIMFVLNFLLIDAYGGSFFNAAGLIRGLLLSKNGKKTCFMVATPLHTSQKREDTYLMIARHPDENHYNEIVVMLGAPYHKTSKPTIGVDNNKVIEMFTDKDKSFVEKTLTEKDLINKMISGNVVRTIGKSQKGTILKDTYSLKGFTKALNAITEECP